MIVQTIPVTEPMTLTAEPLTRSGFAPFGSVVANPAPSRLPSNTPPSAIASGALPLGAVSANQGTAIQYRFLSPLCDLYARAPSRAPATPRLTMFVCGARKLERERRERGRDPRDQWQLSRRQQWTPRLGHRGGDHRDDVDGDDDGHRDGERGNGRDGDGDDEDGPKSHSLFEVRILERHPFTTQTFVPLAASGKRYLVIVAPSLEPGALDWDLPVPDGSSSSAAAGADSRRGARPGETGTGARLPGRGMPDLSRVRAFVARGDQAVTYGAGTWHAPMVALGPPGSAIEFVVTQFANDVPREDCQEVALESWEEDVEGGSSRIMVRIPDASRSSKL
ncbi:hypothetical protein DL766_008389 [Monosporascus sp. MC13-8B]|uniref:Ureidoglycolate hydrolase n=1 Tax=Monosporascus cannonballus TaxID=155416 RepID=A0ABY0HEQ8_9PEZI|nr:hypothetical protein DL763_010344 [Monosporascus cannonballus]RYO89010.1 hypothetical protein DL762_003440 [Monosporascus cannonballus]RYP19611.1 hypothetical protein DL766_008389 [Monosporascus sp. MC13-8B]